MMFRWLTCTMVFVYTEYTECVVGRLWSGSFRGISTSPADLVGHWSAEDDRRSADRHISPRTSSTSSAAAAGGDSAADGSLLRSSWRRKSTQFRIWITSLLPAPPRRLCFCICVFVLLSVSRITRKFFDEFRRNFWSDGYGTSNSWLDFGDEKKENFSKLYPNRHTRLPFTVSVVYSCLWISCRTFCIAYIRDEISRIVRSTFYLWPSQIT